MVKKAPRRTADRILESSLELFNRFGEPNVSTTLIAAELNISPGNLYYHFPAKEELINALFSRYERELHELLQASGDVRHVEDAWFFVHAWFELMWQYRFLYRDLNDLLSNNRHLETHFQTVLADKSQAFRRLLDGMRQAGSIDIDSAELPATADNLVVVLTYWLSFEFVRNPRQALEPENAALALARGAQHCLQLLAPYLHAEQRQHLLLTVRNETLPLPWGVTRKPANALLMPASQPVTPGKHPATTHDTRNNNDNNNGNRQLSGPLPASSRRQGLCRRLLPTASLHPAAHASPCIISSSERPH